MSKAWPMVPLGEVASPVERLETPIPGVAYRQIGVRLWGVGAYEREAIDGGRTKYKTFSRVEADDIIVNKIWARNGSVAVVSEQLEGCYASGEFPIFAPIKEELDSRWVHWLTKTRNFWEKCDEKSRGTSGKNRIRPERFLEIEIPLPPLSEQKRITARLEELSAKIEEARGLRRQAVEEAEALTLSSARNIFSKIEIPLTKVADWLDPIRDGIQTGPFGAQLNRADFVEKGVPLLTIGNIQFSGLKTESLLFVSPDKANQLERYQVREDDILFARMGTVGRCCVVPRQADGWLINYHIIRLALDRNRVFPQFVHWTILASSDVGNYLSEKIRGATRAGVNSKIVGLIPCRIPPLPDQHRIVAYLDGLQTKVDALKRLQAETAAELNAMLPSVLDKAFKGELV